MNPSTTNHCGASKKTRSFAFQCGALVALVALLSNHLAVSSAANLDSHSELQDSLGDNADSLATAESHLAGMLEPELEEMDSLRISSANNADDDEDEADMEAPSSASSNLVDNISTDADGEPHVGLDTNIENAKIELTPEDMATAAGHHHHHKHYVHGKMYMGAESGKKGAFKWHSKYPVGGKGRR